jgi:hypothetical protein
MVVDATADALLGLIPFKNECGSVHAEPSTLVLILFAVYRQQLLHLTVTSHR